jgi:pimeloyl-ACP methyl ester carboxylesterase
VSGPKGDLENRIVRARINNAVQAHFRQGGCGPVDVYEPGVPAPILVGQDDPVVPTAAAIRLADRIRARIEAVECGHGVIRQAPDRARTAIAGFLREVRPRTGCDPGADPATTDGEAGGPA